jgi:hypothetical protein
MRFALVVFGIAFLAAVPALHAQNTDAWKKLDFLLGDWFGVAGEKDGQLGPGGGAFSFKAELNQKIIVRRNAARYDSGVAHDDLMVVYVDLPKDGPRAIYFDTEGHTIRYNLSFPAADRVVFESDGTQPGPRYRLTYWKEGASLNGRFEIAPPSGEYQIYLSWKSKKQ